MKNLLLAVAVAGLALFPQGLSAQKKAKIDKSAGYMDVPWFQNHDRGENAPDGHAYIQMVQDTGFWAMEDMTVSQILSGRPPSACLASIRLFSR